MRQYKVLQTVGFASGVIGLSADQARPRLRALEKTKTNGIYKLIGSVEFKAGEVIGLEEVPKAFLPRLEIVKTKNGE